MTLAASHSLDIDPSSGPVDIAFKIKAEDQSTSLKRSVEVTATLTVNNWNEHTPVIGIPDVFTITDGNFTRLQNILIYDIRKYTSISVH